jgi:hypothetical protein
MTCIVGVMDGRGGVVIGGDSCAADTGTHLVVLRSDPKVFRIGQLILGFTTSFRMGQILQYELEVPDHDEALTCHQYLVRCVVPAVRACLSKGGYLYKENERESAGDCLMAYGGKLWALGADFQVAAPMRPYGSVGSAESVANGALHALHQLPLSLTEQVKRALEAAVEHNAYTRPPFCVVEDVQRWLP